MFGIRVYSICVGSMGYAPYPVQYQFGRMSLQQMEVQIDEELLQQIAALTGGQYFRATDNEGLVDVYEQIDQLEKSKIDVQEFRKKHEMFLSFALWALAIFILEIALRYLYFRQLP
jgi:Ca-activated chloride channel family protein